MIHWFYSIEAGTYLHNVSPTNQENIGVLPEEAAWQEGGAARGEGKLLHIIRCKTVHNYYVTICT